MRNVPRISDAIRDAVNASGRTQGDVADAVGVSQQAVSAWIRGAGAEPNLDTIEKLEGVLGLNRGALLRKAGYVDDAEGVEAALANDITLSEDERITLTNVYRQRRSAL